MRSASWALKVFWSTAVPVNNRALCDEGKGEATQNHWPPKRTVAPADAAASLDNLKPPPGIIIPPPGEIREAIEKTAGYVMRGGLGLEQRIRENHGSNPKFSFLMTASDPYNPYYEWRKDEIRAGRGTAIAAGRAGDAAPAAPAKEVPKGPRSP